MEQHIKAVGEAEMFSKSLESMEQVTSSVPYKVEYAWKLAGKFRTQLVQKSHEQKSNDDG